MTSDSSNSQTCAPTALIVGCGYVGRRLATELVRRGVDVFATARSAESASRLAQLGVRPAIVEVTQRLTLASIRPAVEAGALDVFYLVPPGRANGDPSAREVVLDGTRNVLATLARGQVRRSILISSTAVYGQTGNVMVSADTAAEPGDDRGRLLLDGELNWLAAGPQHHVLRLAGLYGPERIIGLEAVRENHPLVGNPAAVLNLIHVDDAVALLLAMMAATAPGRIELGCDDQPASRAAYYGYLAQKIGARAPEVMDDANAALQLGLNVERLRRASSKTCDNRPTRARTGWSPRFASFKEGLDSVLSQDGGIV